ncbi:COG4280 domain-containing protein [Roseococcus pinisoli]|uniref:TMEM165/GDT1 family protein n=1 Tax=Roseococcus pinisoli TaxID=2835040 RepID=A0ABS5QEE1_9PROT|nr:TMEM165/GDT1 family protein [Roseococcus pinisoli]
MTLMHIVPTAGAAFLASLVECVEAATIVLAVGTVRGWKSAFVGTGLGLIALAAIVLALGPALAQLPEQILQLMVGLLLLLFGMRWLRKAVLRSAGRIPLHDEDAVFRSESANLALAGVSARHGVDPIATATAFKAVLLEGIEVAFIVLAVSAGGPGLLPAAAGGALLAAVAVTIVAFAVHRPLARVPENTLKFAVGIVISAFGIYWTGEGMGVHWPGQDLALLAIMGGLAAISMLGVRLAAATPNREALR